nr:MAG TPA: helix-turn-helix domain protein [Caudoviricetes sp.]
MTKEIIEQRETQYKKIVSFIRKHGHITSIDAPKIGILKLQSRIYELECKGFVFNKPRVKVEGIRNKITFYSIAQSGTL